MEHAVHILGAGGVAGVGLTRCLKDAFEVTGWDDSPWARKKVECAIQSDPEGDLILPVPDSLVRLYAGRPRTFLPPADVVERCQEKHLCAKLLGDLAPLTYWVRDTHGAGGAGAARLDGRMAAEYLPGRNLSCEVLFFDGKLSAWFQKERLSYRANTVEQNVQGIGSSAVSRCIRDSNLLDMSLWALNRLTEKPHGIFAIDFKEDRYGLPLITEINPGRWLTASYVYFYSTGYNLPRLACELAIGIEPTPLSDYPEGIACIRQTDSWPWVGRLPRYDHEAENDADLCGSRVQ